MATRGRGPVAAILVALIVVALYAWRIGVPEEAYYDEVYHAKRAVQLAEEGRLEHRVTTHPPLWHLLSALSMKTLGTSPAAWRLPSLLGGVAVLLLTYQLALVLTGQVATALVAAFLLAIDGVSMTQARMGMLNSLQLAFMLGSLLCFLQYCPLGRWSRRKAFLGAGLLLGTGLATKMTAAYLLIAFVVLGIVFGRRAVGRRLRFARDFVVLLVLTPAAVFLALHLFIPFLPGGSWEDIGRHIAYGYESLVVSADHLYGSRWWSWPLLLRPIWYFYERTGDVVQGVLCIGNPAIFWTMPIALGFVTQRFLRRRCWTDGLVLLGFLALWLPWMFVQRVQFFHFIYPAMPFVCIAGAMTLQRMWTRSRVGRIGVVILLTLAVGLFAYWLPLLTGYPISQAAFEHRMWFPSWV